MEGPKKKRIITAAEAKAEKAKTAKTVITAKNGAVVSEAKPEAQKAEVPAQKKSASGLRIGAIVLWVLAIAFEVGTIYMLNIAETTFAIIGIAADAICCIVGAQLWKRANRIAPYTGKSKLGAFVWNQMGVIACLIAFIPLGLFLLFKAEKVTPQMKRLLALVFVAAFLGSTAASVDYKPVTAESIQQAQAAAEEINPDFSGTVYWTRWGKSYHLDTNCQSLSRSEVLISGTLAEAFEAKRNDPCDFCAGGKDEPATP